jgi:RNA polymerase sigma factor (sigma-70 family)
MERGRCRIGPVPVVAPTPYEQHRDYVLAVLARRCRWLEPDEREATLHDAYTVFLQKQQDGVLDVEAMRPQQVRAYLTQTAINKAMDDGNRARRTRSVGLEEAGGLEVADQRPEVVERLEQGYDAARVREIVEDLPPRQQVVVKLRFFMDMSPTEIQDYLGITERVYRRELERAMRALSGHVDLVRRGTSCDQRRSLILAYVAGIAGPNRMQVARRHLATCPGCAAWAGRLRSAAHQAGAVVPLPLGGEALGGDDRWWAALGHGLGHLRDKALDVLSGGREHVTGLALRTDPSTTTVLGAARPGTVAAVVAGCLTVGGTTYCAMDGVTTPLGGLLGAGRTHAQAHRPSTTPRPAPRRVAMKRPETPAATTARTTTASATTTTRARTSASRTTSATASSTASKASTPAARRVERKAASEFGVEGGGTTATASAASAPASSTSSSSSGGGAPEAAVANEFGP